MKHARASRGFTLVELLIVIVVIAILAAITIVAYGNVTNKAHVSAAQSELKQNSQLIEANNVQNGGYPLTQAAAGLKSDNNTTLTYMARLDNSGNAIGYCLQAVNGGATYHVTDTNTAPSLGGCMVTNYIVNPTFANNTTDWSTAGYGTGGTATTARTAAVGPTGGYALVTTWSTAANSAGHSDTVNFTAPIVAGQQYTMSCYMEVNQTVSTAMVRANVNGTYVGNPTTVVAGTYTRLSYTFTATASSASGNMDCRINDLTGTTNGFTEMVADYMLTQGSTLYNYADGDTPGWTWSGTAGNSTSSGPAV